VTPASPATVFGQLPVLLRGEPQPIREWTERGHLRQTAGQVAVICLGAGLFGAAMGFWRAPLQALYAGIKFPLIILLTVLGNALLNAMLAPLLGLNLRFRQSLLAILSSFTIASAILGAFSPLILFFVWNLPPLGEQSEASLPAYSALNLSLVAVIALAGLAANLKLLRLLGLLAGRAHVANRVLCAWLVGNLFLGSQLTWILRPFIGSPTLAVQFLREDAFHSNFFEAVYGMSLRLIESSWQP
jgi:hypothetical protein